MGLFTEGIEEALSGRKNSDAQILAQQFTLLETEYSELNKSNATLKEEMASLKARVEALEKKHKKHK